LCRPLSVVHCSCPSTPLWRLSSPYPNPLTLTLTLTLTITPCPTPLQTLLHRSQF
jgi:hypothetical protein